MSGDVRSGGIKTTLLLLVLLSFYNIQAQPELWDNFDPYWWNITSIAQEGNDLWVSKGMGGIVKFNTVTEEQEYYKRYYTPLTSNTITKTIVDKQGNKWFGMGSNSNTNQTGIAKYDGQNWEIFNSSNSLLSDDWQFFFEVDLDGNLWVGGEGLLKYDGFVWTKYDTSNSAMPFNLVRRMAVDSSNNLWFICSDGISKSTLVKYDGIGWTIHQPDSNGIPTGAISTLKVDSFGNKWISGFGRIIKYDDITFKIYQPSQAGIYITFTLSLDVDRAGNCYIASYDTGLVKLDTSGVWSVYNISPDPTLNYVRKVFIDDQDNKWLVTYKGLTKFDESEIKSYWLCNAPLIDSRMSDVYIEDDGTIWFGAFSITRKKGDEWRRFDYTNSNFPFGNVNKLEMDDEHNLWVATNAGLVKVKDTVFTVYNMDNSDLPSDWVTDVTKDRNNVLWITTGKGIVKFENNVMTIYDTTNTEFPDDNFLSVEVDRDNVMWFGGYTCGLVKYNNGEWSIYDNNNSGLISNQVWDLAVDTENNIIIASQILQKFDRTNWQTITLPDSLRYQIEVEADSIGNIWTSANQKGIIKIDPWGNLTLFTNQNSGLIGDNQMVHSTRIAKNGYKYFCTNDGGVSVYKGDLVVGIEDQPRELKVNNYSLMQNYPNPFNPTTKISWQSPVSGHQTLKVYDVLGNEVATLVDEYKPAGIYDVQFTMNNLSSGVYFYQLKAGTFTQTKKMILLK